MPRITETPPEERIETEIEIEPVKLFRVIFLNDDVTTFEFVVRILMSLFRKEYATALNLATEVHTKGESHVITLPREPAELRQQQVHDAARSEGFPFRCVLRPA